MEPNNSVLSIVFIISTHVLSNLIILCQFRLYQKSLFHSLNFRNIRCKMMYHFLNMKTFYYLYHVMGLVCFFLAPFPQNALTIINGEPKLTEISDIWKFIIFICEINNPNTTHYTTYHQMAIIQYDRSSRNRRNLFSIEMKIVRFSVWL